MSLEPSFVVTGNQPVVLRESLLPRAFQMAEGTVAASYELEAGQRGMIGPFCLETIVTDQLNSRCSRWCTHRRRLRIPLIGGSPTRTSVNHSCQLDEGSRDRSESRRTWHSRRYPLLSVT